MISSSTVLPCSEPFAYFGYQAMTWPAKQIHKVQPHISRCLFDRQQTTGSRVLWLPNDSISCTWPPCRAASTACIGVRTDQLQGSGMVPPVRPVGDQAMPSSLQCLFCLRQRATALHRRSSFTQPLPREDHDENGNACVRCPAACTACTSVRLDPGEASCSGVAWSRQSGLLAIRRCLNRLL